MKQTAVEWLVDELRKLAHDKSHHLGIGDIRISQGHLDELEEQAKVMETQQQRYSEEEVNNLLYRFLEHVGEKQERTILNVVPNEWFEKVKKK
jgi:hypothetical protein